MGIGSRKIEKGDISKSTKPESTISSNLSIFGSLSGRWEDFIGESELQGKGWESAKSVANVFNTINQTFSMLSEQMSQANQKVISSQSILRNDQIDEQALKQRIEQNKQSMTQLAQARTLFKRNNPEGTTNSFDNLNRAIENENIVLQQELDSLNEFDMSTKYVYDGTEGVLSNLKQLLSQVSQTSNIYDSKTGLFTTKHIDMKNVAKLNKILDAYNETQIQKAIKFINDLYKKNPAAAIEAVKNNKRLFGYLIGALNQCPKGVQDVVLEIFIQKENWDLLPKKAVEALLGNPQFAKYIEKQKIVDPVIIYSKLEKLGDKGWAVLAPLGFVTSILSKTSDGAKYIEASKVGLKLFQKMKGVSDFIKVHPVFKEGFGYGGDGLTVIAYSYDEYTNPDSPAYGDASKAVYGGMNSFLWSAGPLEGTQYAGPVGTVAGTINTMVQMGRDLINSAPNLIPGGKDSLGWSSSEEEKRKWMNEEYKKYDQRKADMKAGNVKKIKEDLFGKQEGRPDVNDFNNGLPRW